MLETVGWILGNPGEFNHTAEEAGDANARGVTSSTQMWDTDISESAAGKKIWIIKKAWRWIRPSPPQVAAVA